MNPLFNEFNECPTELLALPVTKLYEFLKRPTLIHLKGQREPALFVSFLLHGNEHTGFYAFQSLMKKYQSTPLPRNLSVFIGNVEAAAQNQRRLIHQQDYNRIWSADVPDSPEAQMAQEILRIMKERGIFASIDIHNNTGLNPHYACISKLDPRYMNLALLFRRTVVFFTKPHTTQSVVMAHSVPAVTIECGLSENPYNIDPVVNFLEAALHLSEVSSHPVAPEDIDFYETYARFCIPPNTPFAFSHEPEAKSAEIILRSDLDTLNFSELSAGEILGEVRAEARVLVQDPDGGPFGGNILDYSNNQIRINRTLIPSMFTLNKAIILQDCLGYMMRRKSLTTPS
jgi:succinylglutamate desuccinylase